MKNERWQDIERLYHLALDKQPQDRAAFLLQVCAGDEALRHEVESLLVYKDRAKDFIESPAFEVAVKAMSRDHTNRVAVGDRIKQYRIISQLGAGGMGEVYLAEDTRLGRKVALKFLPSMLTKDRAHLHRFEKEARAVAALSHPNVCTIHEVIQSEDDNHCIGVCRWCDAARANGEPAPHGERGAQHRGPDRHRAGECACDRHRPSRHQA